MEQSVLSYPLILMARKFKVLAVNWNSMSKFDIPHVETDDLIARPIQDACML